MNVTPQDLIDFWTAAGSKAWFRADPSFDAAMRERFEATHLAAARGELSAWGETASGALALLLLLDQAPRNIYRGSAHAFATDGLALALATRAVEAGFDLAAPVELQIFFYRRRVPNTPRTRRRRCGAWRSAKRMAPAAATRATYATPISTPISSPALAASRIATPRSAG